MNFIRKESKNGKIIGFTDKHTVITEKIPFNQMVEGDEDLFCSVANYGENYVVTSYHNDLLVWDEDKYIIVKKVGHVIDSITNSYVESNGSTLYRAEYGRDSYWFRDTSNQSQYIDLDEFTKMYFELEKIGFNGNIGSLNKDENFFSFRIERYSGGEDRSNTSVGIFFNIGEYREKGLDLPPLIINKMNHWCWQMYHRKFLTIFGGIFRNTYKEEDDRMDMYKKISEWKEQKGWKDMSIEDIIYIFESFKLEKYHLSCEQEYDWYDMATAIKETDEIKGDGDCALIGLLIAYNFFKV